MIYTFAIIVFFLGVFSCIIIVRPFTVIFHELGHAIPVILFTKQKASIYIGSYGDFNKSIKFKIGLVEVYLKYPFFGGKSVCIPSSTSFSINKQIIFMLCGPIASLMIATVGFFLVFEFDLHITLKILIIFFLGSSIYDFFDNIIPSKKPLKLVTGEVGYNDGNILQKLFYLKRFPGQYAKAVALYTKHDYYNSSKMFADFIAHDLDMEELYRLAISSFYQIKDYSKALEFHNLFETKHSLSADDYYKANAIKSYLVLNEETFTDTNNTKRTNK